MGILDCIFLTLVYCSSLYLHRLIFRTLGIIFGAEMTLAPASVIWLLSALWPLVDIYLAVGVAFGAYRVRKENAD
jgi:hypothetical protein